jgi:serine kinase of HPr protein (carbohydrate metabolism regulator)
VIQHGGLIALRTGGAWRGVLIEGPSGVGKSDLALRCLDHGFRLVADDRVLLWLNGGRLYGKSPETLAGLIEIRGVGIASVTPFPYCAVDLVIACRPGPEAIERLPDETFAERLGVSLPLRPLWPLEPAAPSKIATMLERLGRRA